MGLPQQRQRVVVDGLGKIGEIKENNTVEKSIESGIIREREDKTPITKITDKSIDKVSNAKIQGYTDEQFKFIQQQHKELLKYARDNNENKEVAFVFNGELNNRVEFKGTDKEIQFGIMSGKNLLVMHNHPRNSGYSLYDIVEFLDNECIKTLTVVKNNGNIETLTKVSEINKKVLLLELHRMKKKYVKLGLDSEYSKIIDIFLSKHMKGGLISWEK